MDKIVVYAVKQSEVTETFELLKNVVISKGVATSPCSQGCCKTEHKSILSYDAHVILVSKSFYNSSTLSGILKVRGPNSMLIRTTPSAYVSTLDKSS